MFDNREKIIYFASIINTSKVLIIDGINKSIIKEIAVCSTPQNIVVDENDNVYVANDIKITVIHNLCYSVNTWNMPNNGNIQVDIIDKKIYVSDTEEIYIYNIENGKKITSIMGFTAADCLELDKIKKRLFILDMLQKEVKVYDTEKLNLIDVYKEVGISPCYILLGEEGKCLYIANKGLKNKYYRCVITMLDIKTKKMSNIDIQRGSDIKSLEQGGNYLYAANVGFHRIEVIDIQKKQVINKIKTTLPILVRIRLSKDKKRLLAISCNNEGLSAIDIIDTYSFIIRDTINFEVSRPYDIGDVIQEKAQNEGEPLVFMMLGNEFEEEIKAE